LIPVASAALENGLRLFLLPEHEKRRVNITA